MNLDKRIRQRCIAIPVAVLRHGIDRCDGGNEAGDDQRIVSRESHRGHLLAAGDIAAADEQLLWTFALGVTVIATLGDDVDFLP